MLIDAEYDATARQQIGALDARIRKLGGLRRRCPHPRFFEEGPRA
jgi:hypothetical protein